VSNLLYPVIESPGASALEYLAQATNNFAESSHALLPFGHPDAASFENIYTWEWANDNSFLSPSIDSGKVEECFLFFAPDRCIATQMEGLLDLLHNHTTFELARIISFICADFLHQNLSSCSAWLDGVAHFSDVFCFNGRNNENSSSIKSVIDRYQTLRYPLEFYHLAKKSNPWSRILAPSARRVSHIFESTELLDEEDTPENDPFLRRLPNGNRERPIPIPSL